MQRYFRIDRVVIENYRSIKHCDVRLEQLTFLVGPNGSGKSNFVDALAFVRDSLRHSLGQAASDRQGIYSLLHAPVQLPGRMIFQFEIGAAEGLKARYSLTIKVEDSNSIAVESEDCEVESGDSRHYYAVNKGIVRGSAAVFPPVSMDRLFLANAAGLPEFRPVYDFLSNMAVAEPTPRRLHLVADHYLPGITLRFRELTVRSPDRANVVQDYLRAISETFDRLEVVEFDDRPRLLFLEKSGDGFFISQMSGGILHCTELLLELFDPPKNGAPASLVAIEEPEALLHPEAVHVVRDSFLHAQELRQILITSHSTDLLDDKSIRPEWIRVVRRDREGTHIEALDAATDSIIRDQLYTAGELLRQGGLEASPPPTNETAA